VLRKIFEPNKDEVTESWIKLHYEELYNLCSLAGSVEILKIREDEMSRACSTHEREEKCIQNFGGKT
jgi:hypothetical protein